MRLPESHPIENDSRLGRPLLCGTDLLFRSRRRQRRFDTLSGHRHSHWRQTVNSARERDPEPAAVHAIRHQSSVACQAGESASNVSVLPEKEYWRTCRWPIQLGNQATSTAWITTPASASTVKVPQYPT